jgi:hypothetical protein
MLQTRTMVLWSGFANRTLIGTIGLKNEECGYLK